MSGEKSAVTRPMDRRAFLRRSGLALVGTTAGLGTVDNGYADWIGGASTFRRSFNMLVMGDSVMWGQGLSHDQKFSTLVGEWLAGALPLGTGLDIRVLAHSGATIAPGGGDADPDFELLSGELPRSWPSITRQLEKATTLDIAPHQVDLILMDGGINDVGITRILNPSIDVSVEIGVARVGQAAKTECSQRMHNFLPGVVEAFPQAKVVVTNYFPIVSEQSSGAGVIALLSALGLLSNATMAVFLASLGVPLPPWDPVAIAAAWAALKPRLAAQSMAFHDESTRGLRAAVTAANSVSPGRALFVDVGLGTAQAYATPDTHLFYILDGSAPTDVTEQRRHDCQDVPADTEGEVNVLCAEAQMGHPNPKGARKYADAIISALDQVLPRCQ